MKYGAEHKNWKGDNVGYKQLHFWIRKIKPKPVGCEKCNVVTDTLDLANISQKYIRDVSDWEYLCRRCHMLSDGRFSNLKRGRWKTKTKCWCGNVAVVRNEVCMNHYNCKRRHIQPCNKLQCQ